MFVFFCIKGAFIYLFSVAAGHQVQDSTVGKHDGTGRVLLVFALKYTHIADAVNFLHVKKKERRDGFFFLTAKYKTVQAISLSIPGLPSGILRPIVSFNADLFCLSDSPAVNSEGTN